MSTQDWASFVGAGINFIALVFVAGQLGLANRQLRHAQSTNETEIVRRKRQATIEYFVSTAEHRVHLGKDLPPTSDTAAVERFVTELVGGPRDTPKHAALDRFLSFYEGIAVAVAADVYDLEVLDAIAGGEIRDVVRGYKPFLDAIRTTPASKSWFVELEWLAECIANLRGANNDYRLLSTRRQHADLTRFGQGGG